MNLNDIPKDQIVIVDSSIVLYAVERKSSQCKRFLERCCDEDITGVLTTHNLSNLMHCLMVAEAWDNGWIDDPLQCRQLSRQPDRVRSLTRYEETIRDIMSIGLQIERLEREDFLTAMMIQRQSGLMTDNALLIAVAQRFRSQYVTSTDPSIKSVAGILACEPNDITD